MKSLKILSIFFVLVFVGVGQASAIYELLGDSDGLSYGWEGTRASRLLAETPGEYQFDYGDEANVSFPLPWAFDFDGTTYPAGTNLIVSSDGSVRIGTGGPFVAAWNADLSSHFQGGLFVERKTGPERVVIEWQTETFELAAMGQVNAFEVVLNPYGAIRVNYKAFDGSTTEDAGSGLTATGVNLSLTAESSTGAVPGMPQTSHLFLNDPQLDGDSDQLDNFGEYLANTNPGNPDTDNDGILDGQDPDPLIPAEAVPAVTTALLLLAASFLGIFGWRRNRHHAI